MDNNMTNGKKRMPISLKHFIFNEYHKKIEQIYKSIFTPIVLALWDKSRGVRGVITAWLGLQLLRVECDITLEIRKIFR